MPASSAPGDVAAGQPAALFDHREPAAPSSFIPNGPPPALPLALGLAALLAACGGGGGGQAPGAFADAAAAPYRPLLGDMRAARSEGPLAAPVPTADQVMDWAELAYPFLFPAHEVNRTQGDITFRYYPATGNYVGVQGNNVLVLGPSLTNNVPANVGVLADFANPVAAAAAAAVVPTDAHAARFLQQAQFSSTTAEIAAVRSRGYAAWLQQELARPQGQGGWDWLVAKGYDTVDTNEYFFNEYPGDFMIWYQLLQREDAVRVRVALALSELFVTSLQGINDTLNWSSFVIANYWDTLCANAFGSWRTLLEEVTTSLGMGAYLNTLNNQKEDSTGRVPDENYAREVMQLFTIGLNVLNIDGTPQLVGGATVDTYTQEDVTNLARVFTGYVADDRGTTVVNPKPPHQDIRTLDYARRPMKLQANRHSLLAKRFLGTVIPANTTGVPSLTAALDTLFNHPNVGPFFARFMIQRLVTGNPSPGYVARVATAFNNNGGGVRGDIKAVVRAILLDPEARGDEGLSSPTFGKLREPMVRVAQWARTFGLRSVRGTWKFPRPTWSAESSLAQSPLQSSSVFNFFRPGYVPPSTALSASRATAPEFQIVNESTVSSWVNYLENIVARGVWVQAPELRNQPPTSTPTDGPDLVPDYSIEMSMVTDTTALVRRLNLLLCAGQLSPETEAFIIAAMRIDNIGADASEDFRRYHVARALMFVMCSAEYLVQK